jgi:DNA-binding NtrC family response regulator
MVKRRRKRAPRARRDDAQAERGGFETLVGHSRAMARLVEQLRHVATTRATVLIEGEPGAGKALAARAIHRNSPRRAGPLVALDLAAFAPEMIEGELFGRERAAGEGPRRGGLEAADGGTLYLGEVANAPPTVQVKLLRAIQDRGFERVGGTETLTSDIRLIAGTHVDLAHEVEAGRFRAELYSRLSSVRVRIRRCASGARTFRSWSSASSPSSTASTGGG